MVPWDFDGGKSMLKNQSFGLLQTNNTSFLYTKKHKPWEKHKPLEIVNIP